MDEKLEQKTVKAAPKKKMGSTAGKPTKSRRKTAPVVPKEKEGVATVEDEQKEKTVPADSSPKWGREKYFLNRKGRREMVRREAKKKEEGHGKKQ